MGISANIGTTFRKTSCFEQDADHPQRHTRQRISPHLMMLEQPRQRRPDCGPEFFRHYA